MNKAILMGNLGQEPELRMAQSGTAVLNLRLATNRRTKGADGEWTDETDWHSVVVFGRRAEGLAKVVQKGSKVLVEGRLQTREWEGKDGNKRRRTEVVAWDVELCNPPKRTTAPSRNDDDDIPF